MSRGIVMETGSKHVIVLMPDGQFRKVRTALKPGIGEEFTFSEQRRMQRTRKLYSFSVGAAAIMLLLFVPVIAQHFSHPSSVVAYLTMDVNPSIELGIDKNERVEELRPINTDGEDVTKGLKFKGQSLQTVTEAIMDRISAGPYLNSGEGDVVITSVAVGAQVKPAEEVSLTSHMDDAVRKSLSKTEKGRQLAIEVTTVSAPEGIRDEAKRAGISSGKMAFYLMAKEQGYRISIKDLKQESIHQAAKPMGGVAAVMKNQESSAKVSKPAGTDPNKAQTAAPQTVNPQTVKPQASKPPASKETDNEKLWEKQKQQLEDLLKKEQAKHNKWSGSKKGSGNGKNVSGNGKKSSGNDKSGSGNDRTLQQGGVINISEHSPGNNTGGSGSGGAVGGQGGGSSSSHGKGSSSSPGSAGINGQKNGSGDDRSQGNKSGKGGAGSQGNNGSGGKNGFGGVPWSKPKAPSKQQSQTNSKSSGTISGNKGSDNKEGGREEAKNASDSRHSGVNQGKENQSATREDSSRDSGLDKNDDRDNRNDKENDKDSDNGKVKDKDKDKDRDNEKGLEKDTGKGSDKGKSQMQDSGKNKGNR
ncbi:anti-sigma factor domain-containing protein [Paenibacillus rhizovicinus]|uniref:Anti-sigma factor domain-containing protein n=1 Tax=Paenibacillus rhizovicinus TaxID=2704463 RepID=A0A6C0P449_9BACL|nr:anti-sigma factor domain-containing protein [Paenibacillus rhizovicinus]QHW33298.1 anti-sigma factor domain-containing protein [Paenibacillus rhizovicinus]